MRGKLELGQLSFNYTHAVNSKDVHANSLGKRAEDVKPRNWNEPYTFGEVVFTLYCASGVEMRGCRPVARQSFLGRVRQ